MLQSDDSQLFKRACAKLAENAAETVELYEKYLLDETGWRDLAKMMTKLRASVSAYRASNSD